MSLFQNRLRLKVTLIIWLILLIFWSIALPRLMSSYWYYRQSQQSYERLNVLHQLADLCTLISKERGPANIAMSDFSNTPELSQRELATFRAHVDAVLQKTMTQLHQQHQNDLELQLDHDLQHVLIEARQQVDQFIVLPTHQKQPRGMDKAIRGMFDVWDQSHMILKQFLYRYQGDDKEAIDLFNLTMIITELREQAGRLGSNIVVPLAFGKPMSDVNNERILNNQRNIRFFWAMVGAIDGKFKHDPQYIELEKKVQQAYMDQGLSYVDSLIVANQRDPKHLLNSRDFTENYVRQMSNVVKLQEYVAHYSQVHIEKSQQRAFRHFLMTLSLIIAANLIIFSMLYLLNRHIFAPLLQVRDKLFDLVNRDGSANDQYELNGLFEAVDQVQAMLKKRDELEQHLTFMADTDALTRLYNRTALNKKIAYFEQQQQPLYDHALLVIDIDFFKSINDQYGHTIGDLAIIKIAEHIRNVIWSTDFAVRYGGDELLIILQFERYTTVLALAERLRLQVLENPLLIENQQVNLSVSIGVALGAQHWTELLHHADSALLQAKKLGKNRVQVYENHRLS